MTFAGNVCPIKCCLPNAYPLIVVASPCLSANCRCKS